MRRPPPSSLPPIALVLALLGGCGAGGDESGDVAAPVAAMPVASADTLPAPGLVRGRAFAPDRARLEDGILTISEGDDFFADRSVRLFLFEDDVERGLRTIETDGAGFGNPHLYLSYRPDGEDLPDTVSLTGGYRLTLALGAPTGLGVPFAIDLAVTGEEPTRVIGEYFATFDDLRIVDGALDRTYDSAATIRAVGREWLAADDAAGVDLDELHVYGWTSSGDGEGQSYARVGAGGGERFLRFARDAGGWRVDAEVGPDDSGLRAFAESVGEFGDELAAGVGDAFDSVVDDFVDDVFR